MHHNKEFRRVAFVTPLPDECQALIKALDRPVTKINESPFPYFKSVMEASRGETIEAHIFSQHALGRAHSAALVTFIQLSMNVDLIVVAGTCGAIRREDPITGLQITTGDVVFANAIIDVEIRKFHRSKTALEMNHWKSTDQSLRVAERIQKEINARILHSSSRLANDWFASNRLLMHRGVILSTSSVVADTLIGKQLARNELGVYKETVIAVEMEGAGILTAASIFNNSDNVVMIRGISDFADDDKNDDAKEIACRNAAFVSLEFIKSYFPRG